MKQKTEQCIKKYEKWEEKKYKKRSSDWISEVDNKEKIQELILEIIVHRNYVELTI